MKKAYRMFKRNNRPSYYIHNNKTGEQRSLNTTDKQQAKRLLDAANQGQETPALNMQLGKVYITHADPKMGTRTWQVAMDELSLQGVAASQTRYKRELKSAAYNIIRNKPIVETTSEDLNTVLKRGGNSTNNFLRRLHNLALDNGWIQWHIIPPRKWAKPAKKPKRAITSEEHSRILAAEQNEERRYYYQMLWLIGSAQTDCAMLSNANVDWKNRVLSFNRQKTDEACCLSIGAELEKLLKQLPQQGFLFPKMASLKDKDRSAEFCRRCRLLGITGISLHSYRYAWAERAYAAGYPERFAQAALGHKSRAIHHTYARRAKVICPPLEDMTNKVISLNQETAQDEQRKIA